MTLRSVARFWVIWGMCAPAAGIAYERPTHYDMSNQAIAESVLTVDATVLPSLGLNALTQNFPSTSEGNSGDILGAVYFVFRSPATS
jgi:hypothetical protein